MGATVHERTLAKAAGASLTFVCLAAIAADVPTTEPRDDWSFRVGYAAVPTPSHVRAVVSSDGLSRDSFCANVLTRTIMDGQPPGLRVVDFLRGCKSAVGDAME